MSTTTTDKTTDAVAEAHERLVAEVEGMVSGADWVSMLKVASRLWRYSFSNIVLILSQCPEASAVAGYRAWQKEGRQVRKGERGLRILAPVKYRARPAEDEASAEGEDQGGEGEGGKGPLRVRGWRTVSVFDVSQTDGPEIPEVVSPVLLAGDPPAELYSRLASLVEAEGYRLERGDCDGANGYTTYNPPRVRVRSDVSGAQAAKTLAHELGHVLMHHPDTGERSSRDRMEVEAESVAFVVCAAAGLDTGEYSFPYVVGWSGGEVAEVQATGARVMTTAARILRGAGIGGAETGEG